MRRFILWLSMLMSFCLVIAVAQAADTSNGNASAKSHKVDKSKDAAAQSRLKEIRETTKKMRNEAADRAAAAMRQKPTHNTAPPTNNVKY